MLLIIFYAAMLIGVLAATFFILIPILQLVTVSFINMGYTILGMQSEIIGNVSDEAREAILSGQNASINTLVFQNNMLNLLIQNAWIIIFLIFIVSLFIVARRISQIETGGWGKW